MGAPERPASRSDGIDVLRFFLAFWVLFTHLDAWGGLTGTGQSLPLARAEYLNETVLFGGHGEMHPAVLAFIVLSGYCIHRSTRHGWSVRGYAIRRALRIVPVFLAGALVGALLFPVAWHVNPAATLNSSATTGITFEGMIRKVTALTAVLPIPHMAHNHAANGYQGNGPLYTVAAEMWLYAIYGLVMWRLARGRIRWRTVGVVIAAVSVVGLALASGPSLRDWYFNASVIGFLPLWWVGAWFVGERDRRALAVGVAASLAVWTLCTLWLHHHGGQLVVEGRVLALAFLAGATIRLVDRANVRLPAAATLLGRSGYSLYALHAPVIITLIAFGVPWQIVALVTVAVGVESFRLLERPFTRLGRRLAARYGSTVSSQVRCTYGAAPADAVAYESPPLAVEPGVG